jgi:hypothetical protein
MWGLLSAEPGRSGLPGIAGAGGIGPVGVLIILECIRRRKMKAKQDIGKKGD